MVAGRIARSANGAVAKSRDGPSVLATVTPSAEHRADPPLKKARAAHLTLRARAKRANRATRDKSGTSAQPALSATSGPPVPTGRTNRTRKEVVAVAGVADGSVVRPQSVERRGSHRCQGARPPPLRSPPSKCRTTPS